MTPNQFNGTFIKETKKGVEMLNIEIYGFGGDPSGITNAANMEKVVLDYLKGALPEERQQGVVVTTIPSYNSNMKGGFRRFLRVVSDEPGDQIHIAFNISRALNVDVEWLQLDAFFRKVQ